MINSFEYKGKWKLPESDSWIDGILKYTPDEDISLELFGTFSKHIFDHSQQSIIIGKTTEGEITLVDNHFRSTRNKYDFITIGVYVPQMIFIGKHFNSLEEISFRQVTFRLFNLFNWCEISGIKTDFNNHQKEYSISYKKPNDIDFSCHQDCDGHLTFESPIKLEDTNNKIELEERCHVSLKYKEKTFFEKILYDIIVFQGFLSLSTFEQSYPIKIYFKDDDYFKEVQKEQQKLNIECIYQNTFYNKNYQIRRPFEYLLKFQDISDDFPSLIRNWFEKYKEIEPSFILLLDYFIEKKVFSTEKFMKIVRGLETFHRLTSDKQKFSESEHTNKIITIFKTVDLSEKDKQWLNNLLIYSNELSLKERLMDLIDNHSNRYIQNKVVNKKRFCQKVVDTRNYNTHFDPRLKDKDLKNKELIDVTHILTGLLISCVLGHIGVDVSIIEDNLDRLLY
jgi:hypothetical protein